MKNLTLAQGEYLLVSHSGCQLEIRSSMNPLLSMEEFTMNRNQHKQIVQATQMEE